jgi:hypothetical protein
MISTKLTSSRFWILEPHATASLLTSVAAASLSTRKDTKLRISPKETLPTQTRCKGCIQYEKGGGFRCAIADDTWTKRLLFHLHIFRTCSYRYPLCDLPPAWYGDDLLFWDSTMYVF